MKSDTFYIVITFAFQVSTYLQKYVSEFPACIAGFVEVVHICYDVIMCNDGCNT